MKDFNDLVFFQHPIAKEAEKNYSSRSLFRYDKFLQSRQAKMQFNNGYGISVIRSEIFYSNGIDTYEVAILHNGKLCYDTPITKSVIPYATAGEVSDIMRQIQELPNELDEDELDEDGLLISWYMRSLLRY